MLLLLNSNLCRRESSGPPILSSKWYEPGPGVSRTWLSGGRLLLTVLHNPYKADLDELGLETVYAPGPGLSDCRLWFRSAFEIENRMLESTFGGE